MHYTFSDEVLMKFKNERNLLDLPFMKYSEFSTFYLDDIIIYNKMSSKNAKYDPKTLHFILIDAIVFALNDAGWIASLKKCNFLKTKFLFLGTLIDTKKQL